MYCNSSIALREIFLDNLHPEPHAPIALERIPLTFEHSPRGERSFCILVG
jgi:hypothetical protein